VSEAPAPAVSATTSVPDAVTAARLAAAAARHPSLPAHHHVRAIAPRSASQQAVAQVDASSDAALAQARLAVSSGHAAVSPGAPSDAEIRREVEQAQAAGVVLPTGNTASSFAIQAAQATVTLAQALSVGASIPVASWNPLGKPVADWIVPVLQWASQHGWSGIVVSGYRTFAQQAALNAAGAFSAPAGTSNHDSTAYPGGAVDVSRPGELLRVLPGYPGPLKLVGGVLGPIDPEHFSATGR
jgi:hypothetical protein